MEQWVRAKPQVGGFLLQPMSYARRMVESVIRQVDEPVETVSRTAACSRLSMRTGRRGESHSTGSVKFIGTVGESGRVL